MTVPILSRLNGNVSVLSKKKRILILYACTLVEIKHMQDNHLTQTHGAGIVSYTNNELQLLTMS